MSRVIILPHAERDLKDIWLYIAAENISAADRVYAAINRKAELIATQPMMGKVRDELADDLRSFPEGNYIIFFRPLADGIAIIRVLHSARDVDAVFEE